MRTGEQRSRYFNFFWISLDFLKDVSLLIEDWGEEGSHGSEIFWTLSFTIFNYRDFLDQFPVIQIPWSVFYRLIENPNIRLRISRLISVGKYDHRFNCNIWDLFLIRSTELRFDALLLLLSRPVEFPEASDMTRSIAHILDNNQNEKIYDRAKIPRPHFRIWIKTKCCMQT
jgi:hypothetical protein